MKTSFQIQSRPSTIHTFQRLADLDTLHAAKEHLAIIIADAKIDLGDDESS